MTRAATIMVAAVLSATAGPAAGEVASQQYPPRQYPTGLNCAMLPATERADCERTQIQPPESELPAKAPASPQTGPKAIYPNGVLPPPAMPAPRGAGS